MLHWFNRTALVTTADTAELNRVRQALAAAGIPYRYTLQSRDSRGTRAVVDQPMLSVRSGALYTVYVHRRDAQAAQDVIRH